MNLRRQFFATAFLVFFLTGTLCADALYIGFSAGAGNAVTWTVEDTSDAALGITAGPLLMFQIPFFAVQAQVLYALKGGAENDFDSALRLHYFSTPITAKASFELGPVILEPYLGAEVSFLMKASAEVENESTDVTDSFQATDFGILFGIDLFIEVAEDWYLTVDLRTDTGVVDVAKGGDDPLHTFLFTGSIGFAYTIL